MQQRYDAVVVGTGFGGSVAACRLAQAGLKVGILERGRRYALGTFPRDWSDPGNGWLWPEKQGLFDVRPINEMTIVQGAAYGGGSHLYANVHLRVPPDVFEHGWPSGYRRHLLDPYYDLVAHMLDITPISADQPLGLPPKTTRLRRAAAALGRSEQFCLPTLAVNFGDPQQLRPNKFGVEQYGCRHCGECDIGCNFQAKNTLDLNYLAVAEQYGADVGTRCEVTRIERAGDGYQVSFTNHETGGRQVVRAPVVVLGAGAVNTTELLLRCRDQHRTLPDLSPRLGHGYSGNGDFLAFAVRTSQDCQPWAGPTITTGIVYDRGKGADRHWFIFEEGGFPRQLAGLISLLGNADSRFAEQLRVWREGLDAVRAEARERIGMGRNGGDDGHSAVFLAMGRDSADGHIELLPVTHELRVRWNLRENLGLYQTEQRLCADMAKALGGQAAYNPLWQALRLPVSVHNLGGCVLGDDAAGGVLDGDGAVFGYPNLYVMDGACLPSATGVNPSHTIAAVAERNIETAIRKITGQPRWIAPERARAVPVRDPLAAVRIPAGGTKPPRTQDVGLSWVETMRGTMTGGRSGPATGNGHADSEISVRLELATPSVADLVGDPRHQLSATGTIHCGGFTGTETARIGGGVVHLLAPGEAAASRSTRYTLPFFGVDGEAYLFDAGQDIASRAWWDVWRASTTVQVRIRAGHTASGPVLATGRLRLTAIDIIRELVTARITGAGAPLTRLRALADIGQLFAGAVWDVFLRPHRATRKDP
jgi:cholesterol oxidase